MATDAVYIRMLDPFLHVYKIHFERFSLEYLSCVYGCFTWGRWTSHSNSFSLTKKKLRDHALFSTFLCSKTIQQNCFRYDQSQSNVPLGHPYWFFFFFFFHVHKTARWRWGTLHSPEVVNTVDPLLSYCQFAFIVIVPDSCLCFISCLGANRGDAIT